MRRMAGALAALLITLAASACQERPRASDSAATAQLIPRSELFGDAARSQAALNPQGDQMAFLAPSRGSLNIWASPPAPGAPARLLTRETGRGVTKFRWAETGRHIVYGLDRSGDENWRIIVVDVATGETRDLTPIAGVQAHIVGASPAEPNIIIAAINERDRAWHDLFRIDIITGERTALERNTQGFAEYFLDRSNRVRLALKTVAEGASEIWTREEAGGWRRLLQIPFEDSATIKFLSFDSDGRSFLMIDSTGRDRAALVRVDAETGSRTVLGESQRADVADAWLHPLTREPQAFMVEYLRREWRAIAAPIQADIDTLDAQLTGDFYVVSRSGDDLTWLVVEEGPRTPARTWLYTRGGDAPRLTALYSNRPTLETRALASTVPVEIPSRDGLNLVSYLTLPAGADTNDDSRPETALPLVLLVHGGPWMRDSFGWNATHQWLANRGYAVLSVNFRGSTGFGKAFLNSGNREWGGAMQDDLTDAVGWAIAQGVTAPGRVAIMGASYGGYAALAGMAFTPDLFACGVSLSGPGNLITMLSGMPDYWRAYRAELYRRVGDPGVAAQAAEMRRRSPALHTAQIRHPILIAHGGNDPRVPRAESDQMSAVLSARRVPHLYLLYPDEGHGIGRVQNRISYYAAVENFLARRECLGGLAQPVGRDIDGSSVQTLAGAELVTGLRETARATRRPAPRPRPQAAPAARADSASEPELARDAPIATSPAAPDAEAPPKPRD